MHRLPFVALLVPVLLSSVAAFSELRGVSLTGCVLLESPYVVADSTRLSGFGGIALEYLHRLRDNLEFQIQLRPWNRSFSDFIRTMAVCDPLQNSTNRCPCDVGVGSFTMTNERAEDINFVWPFSNEAHAMVSRKSDLQPSDSQNAWFVFKTFPPNVWIVIMFGVVLHAVGTLFFGPFCDQATEATRNTRTVETTANSCCSLYSTCWLFKRFPAAMLFAYAHLVGHPHQRETNHTPSFHRSAWLVLGVTAGIFLLTVYEASLTVLLFESTKESPFRSLDDITDCNLNPARVAMISGGASQKFWNTAVNTSEHRSKCSWDVVGVTVANLEEGFSYLTQQKADYFYSLRGSVLFRANRNCEEFEPVGEPFFSTSVGFVMAKRANRTILDNLSRETRILREQDAFESASLLAARTACEDVVDATITLGKLTAFCAMYLICWAVLVLYRVFFLWKRSSVLNKDVAPPYHGATEPDAMVMNMHSMPAPRRTDLTSDPEHPYDVYRPESSYTAFYSNVPEP